jgi:hypothetical protein
LRSHWGGLRNRNQRKAPPTIMRARTEARTVNTTQSGIAMYIARSTVHPLSTSMAAASAICPALRHLACRTGERNARSQTRSPGSFYLQRPILALRILLPVCAALPKAVPHRLQSLLVLRLVALPVVLADLPRPAEALPNPINRLEIDRAVEALLQLRAELL